MKQLRIDDAPLDGSQTLEPTRPFLTDPMICERLGEVEATLRALIRRSAERPYVEIGRCADLLHKLARDLRPEVER